MGLDVLFRESYYGTSELKIDLGLYYARLLAVRLGATLEAHSDGPSLGSSFVLTLPLGKPSLAEGDELVEAGEEYRPSPVVYDHPPSSSVASVSIIERNTQDEFDQT